MLRSSENKSIIRLAAPSSDVTALSEYAKAIIKSAAETPFMPETIISPTSTAVFKPPLSKETIIKYVTASINASTILTLPKKIILTIPTPKINNIGISNSMTSDGGSLSFKLISILSFSETRGEEPGLTKAPVFFTLSSAVLIGPKSGISPVQINNVKINKKIG